MKKRLQQSVLAGAVAAVVGGAGIQEASADALMFPYLAASDTVTTIISVVNHGMIDGVRQQPHTPLVPGLHYAFFHKTITGDPAVDQISLCDEFNYFKPTSPEDLVTFDTTGHFGDAEGVMFNDPTNYTNGSSPFTEPMSSAKPARAFLLVDDNTDQDAQLYGEAVVMEFAGGAAWGYRAYNSTDGDFLNPDFGDGNDLQGEVLGFSEYAQVQFMPFDQIVTKFFVTPVNGNQDTGDLAVSVRLKDESVGLQNIVAWDRDENPISGFVPRDVVCVAAKSLEELMTAAAANNLRPKGGWSYFDTGSSSLLNVSSANGAVVYKLKFSKGATLDGVPLVGVFNNAIQLTDSGSVTKTVGKRLAEGQGSVSWGYGTNGF